MHRGLEIFEITEIICGQLGPEALGTLSKDAARDLNALARTSKLFLDPALSVLWRHQNTIMNLLRCMPDDLWDITELDSGEDQWEIMLMDDEDIDIEEITRLDVCLRRPITKADWERPHFYSHRVKAFAMDIGGLLETVTLCLPGECIFPKLTNLCWHLQPPTSFHHVRLFLTPCIKELLLGSIRTISHLSVLPNLAVECPALTNVTISVDGISLSDSSRPFRSCPPLTKLTVSTMECATALISTMLPNRPFVEITIARPFLHPPPTKTIARQFYSSLAKHCSHSSLQQIHILDLSDSIHATVSAHSGSIDVYLAGGDLRPLFSFTNLIRVTLEHPLGFDLDDATSGPSSPCALEGGIYAFAKHCPTLNLLQMTFDATVVPKINKNRTQRVAQESLDCINVALSLIKKPKSVAKFLFAIFPHLECIQTMYEYFVDVHNDEEDD
ncbi:hypothetical protein C8R44DRAFT_864890 [Mycena epipterygia]|nr:hypothetical protein C8R44DRAFT_864890 [Mycena epipterygia]